MCCHEFAYISHNCALKLFGTYNKTGAKATYSKKSRGTRFRKLFTSDQLCQKWFSGTRNQLNLEVSISCF